MSRDLPPEAALRPVRADARALLTVWFVRKSFHWVLWLGLIGAAIGHDVAELDVDVRQLAIRRLGRTGHRLSRLDPVMDIANIVLPFVAFAVLLLVASNG